ncbi:probable protein phosphatase 2C 68 [Cryptomeria japonica]|uniref:probable protein phosphatase 2C 68 n=1 Tax=Cryptomeria japonica TaxID=3369 RepID=UPI0027DA61DB|nr:probable protein phosphatase 2C 68 [Cryptomeria japonica]
MGMEAIRMSAEFDSNFLKRSVSLRSGYICNDGIFRGAQNQNLSSELMRLARSKSIPLESSVKVKSIQPAAKSRESKPLPPDKVTEPKVTVEKSNQTREEKMCPPYGMMSVIGTRPEMEDTVAAVPSFCKGESSFSSSNLHFFGVYDGHGGSQVAGFCRERLHEALAEQLRALPPSRSKDWRRDPSEWETAVKNCFNQVDIEVGGLCPTGKCCYRDGEYCGMCKCRKAVAPDYVGSAAVVAVVSNSQIVVGNCGDSRALLCRAGTPIPLSSDHKADRPDEIERIEAAGGQVVFWKGYRVGGLLAVSRAIGDRFMKDYVISEPEVTCSERTGEDEFVILASDGVWDVISNEYACQVVGKCLDGYRPRRFKATNKISPAVFAASFLTKMAVEHGSSDNISVVVIDLHNDRTRRNQNIH